MKENVISRGGWGGVASLEKCVSSLKIGYVRIHFFIGAWLHVGGTGVREMRHSMKMNHIRMFIFLNQLVESSSLKNPNSIHSSVYRIISASLCNLHSYNVQINCHRFSPELRCGVQPCSCVYSHILKNFYVCWISTRCSSPSWLFRPS